MEQKVKTFLDSVHGHIKIPANWCAKVIDTPEFQRLRRIEQNSCRSVFPSARHDRFIHSLGVYYLGNKIADSLLKKDCITEDNRSLLETYKLACLLHDVGHTPFSHTFEDFFDKEISKERLVDLLKDNEFNEDLEQIKNQPASHEILSAYVAVMAFKPKLGDNEIDWILLSRMIIGCFYTQLTEENSLKNALIELLHGEIIDADGLDYVCRDVWAGGYRNFSIDCDRLIDAITIKKADNDLFQVVYSSKALNEIESVLNIKNFQYLYVLNHHKVCLEQHILVEAMKSAAAFHLSLDDDKGEEALRKICNIDIFLNGKVLPKFQYKLYRPIDDDFVALMKLVNNNGNVKYITQWLSRRFDFIPLWKSKLEYFNIFKELFQSLNPSKIQSYSELIGSDLCKKRIIDECNILQNDIIIKKINSKIRSLNEKRINIELNDKIYAYSDLKHDMFAVLGDKIPFSYIYVNLSRENEEDKAEKISRIISIIKDFVSAALRREWNDND